MINRDKPTFPVITERFDDTGLTKREWMAAMVMQGYLANRLEHSEFVAAQCVLYADALLAKLEKE